MKRTGIALALSLCLLLLTACGGQAVSADVDALADGLKSAVTFQDELTAMNDAAFDRLYAVDKADVVKKKVYVSTGATAEEIAVFEAADEKAAGRIKEAVLQRIEDQKEGFVDYVPAEMTKLNDPVLVTKGKYVVLCLSNENDKAKAEIDAQLK